MIVNKSVYNAITGKIEIVQVDIDPTEENIKERKSVEEEIEELKLSNDTLKKENDNLNNKVIELEEVTNFLIEDSLSRKIN